MRKTYIQTIRFLSGNLKNTVRASVVDYRPALGRIYNGTGCDRYKVIGVEEVTPMTSWKGREYARPE